MIHQRHRRTDGWTHKQTTCDSNTALCTVVHRMVKSGPNTKTLNRDGSCESYMWQSIVIDTGDLATFVLLDPSAAFVSVNHSILVWQLETFRLSGTALCWFKSYLVGQLKHIHTTASSSTQTIIVCSIPQGSELSREPLTVLLYIADLQSMIECYCLCLHHFADITQIYGFCSLVTSSCTELESYLWVYWCCF